MIEFTRLLDEIIKTKRKLRKIKKRYKALCKIEEISKSNNLKILKNENGELIIKGFLDNLD